MGLFIEPILGLTGGKEECELTVSKVRYREQGFPFFPSVLIVRRALCTGGTEDEELYKK